MLRANLNDVFQFINIICFYNSPRQGIGKTVPGQSGKFLVFIFRLIGTSTIGTQPPLTGIGDSGGQIGLAYFVRQNFQRFL